MQLIGDTGMALRNAKAGLCILVNFLVNSGNEKQLIETGATTLIPNVGPITPELLLDLLTTT